MVFTVRNEPKEGFLHIFLEGEYDLPEIPRILQGIIDGCVDHKATKVLIDLRSLAGNMTSMERFNIAQAFALKYFDELKAGRISPIRFAYLGNYPMIDPNKFGETVAVNRGLTLKATTELKEALDWLLVDPTHG